MFCSILVSQNPRSIIPVVKLPSILTPFIVSRLQSHYFRPILESWASGDKEASGAGREGRPMGREAAGGSQSGAAGSREGGGRREASGLKPLLAGLVLAHCT